MATSKYSWPLPGEAVTAKELFAAELRAAFPGLASYSEDGRTYAMLAEFVAQFFNGFPVGASPTFPALTISTGPLTVQGSQQNAIDLSSGKGNVAYGATLLTTTGGAAVTPTGYFTSVQALDNSAFTMNVPSPLPSSGTLFLVNVNNGSGGAMGTVNWNAAYHFAGGTPPSSPGTTKNRLVLFMTLGAVFLEVVRSTADT